MAVAYWLVNSGTREEPWSGDLRHRYRQWNDENGDVQMFPWRPARLRRGDMLVHRAVGSSGNRLVAVGEVLSAPSPSGHERWPWQVQRRLLEVCATLDEAPSLQDIGVSPAGLRVMKAIDAQRGALAVSLIRTAADRQRARTADDATTDRLAADGATRFPDLLRRLGD